MARHSNNFDAVLVIQFDGEARILPIRVYQISVDQYPEEPIRVVVEGYGDEGWIVFNSGDSPGEPDQGVLDRLRATLARAERRALPAGRRIAPNVDQSEGRG